MVGVRDREKNNNWRKEVDILKGDRKDSIGKATVDRLGKVIGGALREKGSGTSFQGRTKNFEQI